MTPLDLIFRSAATAIAVALAAAAALALAAAFLDYLSGTTGRTPPFVRARERQIVFLAIGVPALIALFAATTALAAIGSGSASTGIEAKLLVGVVDAAFVIAVLVGGACSPLARNWVIATFALLGSVVAFIALLVAVAAEPSGNEAGLLTNPGERLLFGLTIAGLNLALWLGMTALLALLAYAVERVVLLLRARRFLTPFYSAHR